MPKVILEYVWLDAKQKFRTKVKIVDEIHHYNSTDSKHWSKNAPMWNYDGSSTGQAEGHDSEILLKPYLAVYSPYDEKTPKFYVFCESLNKDGTPAEGNTRHTCVKYFEQDRVKESDPIFGMEQEFYVLKDGKPLVWSDNPEPQGDYYCGVGHQSIGRGRAFLEEMTNIINDDDLKLNITGTNMEVGPGQMEVQLCEHGLEAADKMLVMRFFMIIEAEARDLEVDFTPKPSILSGPEWNGSGCHVNFSTKEMREDGESPLSAVLAMANALQNLKDNHSSQVQYLGSENNRKRLTGENETSSYDTFTYGVAHRGASARIPRQCVKDLKGYIEDRRPGSDMDPYVVLPLICEAGIQKSSKKEQVHQILHKILAVHSQEYL